MHSRELAMTLLLTLGSCAQSASVDTIRNDPGAHTRARTSTNEPRAEADAVNAEPAVEEVEHCRARVCPRWKGAAAVNTAARVRTRKAP